MKLSAVVALGNPGLRYCATRHNVAMWLIDSIMKQNGASFKKHRKIAVEFSESNLVYLKSTDYMNNSGIGVGAYLRYKKISAEEVLVIHDELDLNPGSARLKFGGGNGGHNGLKSIIAHLQSSNFWRIRLGIGRPSENDVSNFVLGVPGISDALKIRSVISKVADNFTYLEQGDEQAFMRIIHG